MNSSDKNKIWDIIQGQKKNICIFSHTNPDGDAMGSALAIKLLLKKFNHNVKVVVPNIYPEYYAWLAEADEIIIGDQNKDETQNTILDADLLFFMDLNKIHRVEGLEDIIVQNKCTKILFDHHVDPDSIFHYKYWRTDVSSTCELLYEFIEFHDKSLIDKDMAACLYTGIVTDTGSFFHGNMTAATFQITADLMEIGIDIISINQLIYNTFSEGRLRLLGHSISNRLHIIYEKAAAYIFITKEDLEKYNYQKGDSEGIVNYALSLKGIKISVLFVERAQYIKISFRSEGDCNVNTIAVKYFNGGGHKNASGAHFYGNIDEAINIFTQALKEI